MHSSELYFNSMPIIHIHLNDFISFDNFLFGNWERDWTKFLDEDEYFISPIANPVNIAQYQLCHYAYWMTIAENDFRVKPCIISASLNINTLMCYACAYAKKISPNANICHSCPLKKDPGKHKCGFEYSQWMCCLCENPRDAQNWAEKVAKMTWKNSVCDDISEASILA